MFTWSLLVFYYLKLRILYGRFSLLALAHLPGLPCCCFEFRVSSSSSSSSAGAQVQMQNGKMANWHLGIVSIFLAYSQYKYNTNTNAPFLSVLAAFCSWPGAGAGAMVLGLLSVVCVKTTVVELVCQQSATFVTTMTASLPSRQINACLLKEKRQQQEVQQRGG